MSTSLARRERAALCDLAAELGPDAPTLCEGWAVRDLLQHLVVRDRPWLGFGQAGRDVKQQPFDALVDRGRTPPLLTALGPVERAMNTVEFFIHHEDVRRAQPDWSARTLDPADERTLSGQLGLLGRVLARGVTVPLVVDDGIQRRALRRGPDPVVLTGRPGEVVLFLFGRAEVDGLSFDGPPESISSVRNTRLGF